MRCLSRCLVFATNWSWVCILEVVARSCETLDRFCWLGGCGLVAGAICASSAEWVIVEPGHWSWAVIV
ncbi:unnamed protein product [Prunus armeniaca]